jgi:hypothetical protein
MALSSRLLTLRYIIVGIVGILLLALFAGLLLNKRLEGFAGSNNKYKYYPDRKAANADKEFVEFGIADFEDEAKLALDFLKFDNKLLQIPPEVEKSLQTPSGEEASKPSATSTPSGEQIIMDGDYTKPHMDLEIHKLYTQYTTESAVEKTLDSIYGTLFDFNTMRDRKAKNIETMFRDIQDKHPFDFRFYDGMVAHVTSPAESVDPPKLEDFFLKALQNNNSDTVGLQKVRKTMYTILTPSCKHNQLLNLYLDNEPRFRNVDGSNALIYVLNTSKELIATPLTVPNEDFLLDVDKDKELFTEDKWRLYKCCNVLMRTQTMLGSVFNRERFVGGFPQYLAKTQKVLTGPSVCVYLLTHPPAI